MSVIKGGDGVEGIAGSVIEGVNDALSSMDNEMDRALASAMGNEEPAPTSSRNSMVAKDEPEPEPEPNPEVDAPKVATEEEPAQEPEPEAEPEPEEKPSEDDEPQPESMKFDSWDEVVTLPDGTTKTLKEIYDEPARLRHDDYSRKTQSLAVEKEMVLSLKDKLESEMRGLQERMKWADEVNELRAKSPEYREELAALHEQYSGSKATAEEIKADPSIQDLRIKLARLEAEREATQEGNKSREIREVFDSKFTDLSAKYPHADKDIVESLIISGKFDKLEQAMRHSHDLIQSKVQGEQKQTITKKASVSKTRPPAPVRGKVSPVAQKKNGSEWESGNIFDDDWNAAMDRDSRESGQRFVL